MRIPFISLAAAGALALGGCSYGGLGLGMGYGDPYYGGGYGYGSPYGYGGYGGSYYGGSYAYGSPYYGYGYAPYGWYNDYYYPGSGYYVYDNHRRARTMTDSERAYWLARVRAARLSSGATPTVRTTENWSGFRHRTTARTSSTNVSNDSSTTTTTTTRQRSRDGRRSRSN